MTNSELRQMVRDILREVVPAKGAPSGGVETVRIGNDAELMAFARRVVEMQAAVSAGQLRFTLGNGAVAAAQAAAPLGGQALQGVVSEHVVNKHASAGVLVLAAGAVITPLARDRARKLGLKIERRR